MNASVADRLVILSTDVGKGTGAYTMLSYFLEAAANREDKPVLVLPACSEVYAHADELGYVVMDLGVRSDRIALTLPAIIRLAPKLKGIRGVVAWHTRGFELALYLHGRLGVPVVAIYHDSPDSPSHGFLRRCLMRWNTTRFDGRIFVSHATRALWTPWIMRGINTVVHNGIPDLLSERLPAPDRRIRVGFLGMYVQHKGFPLVANWIADTVNDSIVWYLYGELAANLAEAAQDLVSRFPNRVRLCGRKRPADIFQEIDILVQPSTSFDPFPTVLLESARAGIPVVSSQYGGSREIVMHGTTGVLFDTNQPETGLDALRQLVRDDGLRKRMGREARLVFEHNLGVQTMVKSYFKIWNEICSAYNV